MKRFSEIKKRSWPLFALGLLAGLGALIFYFNAHDFVIGPVHYLRERQITTDEYFIAIRGDRISYIGKTRPLSWHSLSGKDLILAPGFIDTNSMGFVRYPFKLFDGITTALSAHGDSFGNRPHLDGKKNWINSANTASIVPLIPRLHEIGFNIGKELEAGLKLGAYGVALAPEYSEITTRELVHQICVYFSGKKIPISFHLRYSTRKDELSGLDEALSCAKLGNPVHLLHLSSTGATYHPEEAIEKIHSAQRSGADVFMDFYPYTVWQSSVNEARFTDDWMKRYEVTPDRVWIAGERKTPVTPDLLKKYRLNHLAAFIDVDNIPQKTVDYFALRTNATIGTDSANTTHPRGMGSFTKFINDYVDTGQIPFEQALYRFSTAAAERFASYIPDLSHRGKIEVGYYADLILWDRAKIKSEATYDEPKPSQGVSAAFLNGNLVISNGRELSPMPEVGRFLPGRVALK